MSGVERTCPKCGGENVRQVTPGWFECETEVEIGWHDAPPEVTLTGMFERRPIFGPCEHRFQSGAGTAPMCQVPDCGRDSIGVCQGECGRRLCGLCGSRRGPFLCADCTDRARAAQRRRAEDEKQTAEAAAAREATALQRNREAACAELETAADARTIITLICSRPELLSRGVCESAWRRLIAGGTPRPTHELATAVGRGHFLILSWQNDPGWNWRETGTRKHLWHKDHGEYSSYYFDEDGLPWIPTSSLLLGTPNPFFRGSRNHVALPPGAPFRASACIQATGLVLFHNARSRTAEGGSCLSRVELDEETYAQALAALLSEH